MISNKHAIQITVLRSAVWIAGVFAVALFCAWQYNWQIACWVALTLCSMTMVWHLAHLEWLLTILKTPANTTTPTTLGLWGEAFYFLHRKSRQHGLDIAQLNEQQARFTQAIQVSPNAFVMLDDAGRVAWMNSAAQALLGLDAARDTGQNLAYLLRTPAVAALLDSTRLSSPVTVLTQGKTISVQALPFGDNQTLLLGQDLTELERTERVRRDFVANVSHELRTPLTVLSGYAELLHDHTDQLPAAMQDAVAHMLNHTQRMSHLTQDLLQLATLDAGGTLLDSQSTELIAVNQWLTQVQQSTTPMTQGENSPRLVFDDAPAEWVVNGLQIELHSALSNLVTNALRYTPAGGTVRVSSAIHSGLLHIAVIDTGCGIAAEHLPRLTERFYRVSASRRRTHNSANSSANSSDDTSNDNSGTGLGLAIVKHIMIRHGGELRIASELGKGSVFTLVLPAA